MEGILICLYTVCKYIVYIKASFTSMYLCHNYIVHLGLLSVSVNVVTVTVVHATSRWQLQMWDAQEVKQSDSQVNSCWENRNLWLVIEQASVGTGRVTVAVIKQTLHQASTKNRNRWFSLMVKSLHSCFSYQCLYQSEIKEAIQTGLHWWLRGLFLYTNQSDEISPLLCFSPVLICCQGISKT